MGRPRLHDDATRERLLRAAETLVADGGVEALSIRRIADAVGTTTRAVYSVFGGKDGLVQALREESWRILAQRLEAHRPNRDPIEDAVHMAVDVFRWFALTHPNLFRLTFETQSPTLDPDRHDGVVGLATRGALVKRVQRLADAGLLGGRSASLAAAQFHTLCAGLACDSPYGFL